MMTFAEAQLHRQPCGLSFESFNFLKDRGDVTQAVADGVSSWIFPAFIRMRWCPYAKNRTVFAEGARCRCEPTPLAFIEETVDSMRANRMGIPKAV
jgi:hypothetical protein